MDYHSDNNLYLSFKTNEDGKFWDYVKVGWIGDGSGIKVLDKLK